MWVFKTHTISLRKSLAVLEVLSCINFDIDPFLLSLLPDISYSCKMVFATKHGNMFPYVIVAYVNAITISYV